MVPARLDSFATVTINSAGVGTVSIPVPRGERWHVTRYTVLTNQSPTATVMPIATLYVNQVSDAYAVDSTYTGARDAGDGDIWLEGGETLLCQWTGGIAATIATLSIVGTKELVR